MGDCEASLLNVIARRTGFSGIHICAEEASEMIQILAIAVGIGATVKDFVSVMAVHPTRRGDRRNADSGGAVRSARRFDPARPKRRP
ncbi:hypothetical protein [Rhizobium jaguaris]|uniref:Pyridine nucleotide-disulphide oxidoreductase dimerisation domain-containing protein n=1 Tax=Rhizobium jaguaris TaxID=1312183 RepID=A0A387FSF5_9HYPH|nr:hypothetical protein [Rhizobium jaguaris]AYG62190.1 hypothetical protein CCGE525_25495 [Rhizobium jaguaris]